MLEFYCVFSLIVFFILGISMIVNKGNKAQQAAGSVFVGMSSLGVFCLLIEFFIFRGI